MEKQRNNLSLDNARDHMANERTFLAWIRTSIGVIAFGFVIERFSLFTKQISLLLEGKMQTQALFTHGYSSMIGIFLVLSGTMMALVAFMQFKKSQKQINQGVYQSASILYLLTTFLIFAVGFILVLYLISFHKNP